MRIYLFLDNKIMKFIIPSRISGNYSFDENIDEESKLINIEARDNRWYLYTTVESAVLFNGQTIEKLPLESKHYYTILKNDKKYIIYVTNMFDGSFDIYNYGDIINLTIGSTESCNVIIPDNSFNGTIARIFKQEGILYLDSDNPLVYINDKAVAPRKSKIEKEMEQYALENMHENSFVDKKDVEEEKVTQTMKKISNGDEINILGLVILVYNGILMINKPLDSFKYNLSTSGLTTYQYPELDSPADIEVKDVDLYTKDDYYSKAPRIRRLIKTKEIELSPPPRNSKSENMPAILTFGPMITMGLASSMMLVNNITRIASGESTFKSSLPMLITSLAMLLSSVLWPNLSGRFTKKLEKMRQKDLEEKYTKYLEAKREELRQESKLQSEILIENLVPINQCLDLINAGNISFWDKRIEQNDFLEVRLGMGDELLDVNINYPKEGFTIEEDALKKKADDLIEEFKYIKNVPIGYSLYNCKMTAIMGDMKKCYGLVNNILLQLITFYSYEDIKFVVFTNDNKKDKWEFLREMNYSFSNDKTIRFFSTDVEEAKRVNDYLSNEMQIRINQSQNGVKLSKPYYVIITDDYTHIKGLPFIKSLTESDENIGFSLVIIEDKMSHLPSKCDNFINLRASSSGVLRNSFESQEVLSFKDEINYDVDMMEIARRVSNIPIEFAESSKSLPESITFLEMEKVGKVEQLNILNRWDYNDSTTSLRAEVGVDEDGNLMYLDIHEKYHGPHGLIAGMTGSGKSEFIITYILSLCINYSPDDVSFILIDYKGGGLAGAFENKTTGVSLPHLAGIITNLDKAEMDRTLVSIDSEIKRRQKIFNEARDLLGQSTIDIYKYQKFYKEGKLKEPIPHLLIICDEFAELKSQQPDFMDNLISVARIGRSLGIHLILATQKPSGVVNDQIWSNTKFRVCLKVQDESDSKEMLKRPDAASIKQVGRYYLQVGYDEYFALGQSGWCGAKYYPSERIVKQIDKSVNIIGDTGNIIKSVQVGNNIKIEAKGEQLSAIMKSIINVARLTNKKSKRLWLPDIDPIILVDDLEEKYNFESANYDIKAIIGEYDAPEKQEQGLLTYSLNEQGNTLVIGNDEIEREGFVNSVIYSICKHHTTEEINMYIVDYGSEQFRMFNNFPQIGGMVFAGEEENLVNLFKLINNELKERKKMLIPYGGSIDNYNAKNDKKIPRILFIINNYEGLAEVYPDIFEDISAIGRECERYGIILLLTCGSFSVFGRKMRQCFDNKYALHLNSSDEYYGLFNGRVRTQPRDRLGRGLTYNDGIHEFQTSSIVDEEGNLAEFIQETANKIKEVSSLQASPIPTLPDKITLDFIKNQISTINKVPIGVSKNTLKVIKYDFTANKSNFIIANKIEYTNSFVDSLLDVLLMSRNVGLFVIDATQSIGFVNNKEFKGNKINYINSNFEEAFDKLIEIQEDSSYKNYNFVYVFYGLDKLKQKVETSKIEKLFDIIKPSENGTMIFVDGTKSLKSLEYESWFVKIKNNTDGIWIGKGFAEQQNFRVSRITKEMYSSIKNNYGYYLNESYAELVKLIEFNNMITRSEEEEEENEK